MIGLDKKKIASIIMARVKPKSDNTADFVQRVGEPGLNAEIPLDEKPEDDHLVALESAMDDLIEALASKDAKLAAVAFKEAMDICEMMPHEEYEDEEEADEEKE